jgi:hypothetical protein
MLRRLQVVRRGYPGLLREEGLAEKIVVGEEGAPLASATLEGFFLAKHLMRVLLLLLDYKRLLLL